MAVNFGDTEDTALREDTLVLTTEIVTAYLSNNSVKSDDIPGLIRAIHGTLNTLGRESATPVEVELKPAVPIKKSVTPEYIICLEDGKKLKMLKRYIRTRYNLTPEEYRAKWNLPADYPMVAPDYANKRSEFAKQIGLGRGGRPRVTRKSGRRKA